MGNGVAMKYKLLAFVLLLSLGLAGGAPAKEAAPAADDPALERRVMNIASKLRCLQCQNQSIAESNAPLAADLRNEMREQLRRGLGDREVIDFMVARYGDFVLLSPPFKLTTALLWLGPLLLVVVGLIAFFRRLVRWCAVAEVELSEADHARALRLLGGRGEGERR